MIALIQFEEIIDGTQVIFYAFTNGHRRTTKWITIRSLLSCAQLDGFPHELPDTYVVLISGISHPKQLLTTRPELFI